MISTNSAGTNGFCGSSDSGLDAACGAQFLRGLWHVQHSGRCRCRSQALRATSRRRCSVSAALRPAMRKHLRHGLLSAHEHRRDGDGKRARACYHDRGRPRRARAVCARGLNFCRRRGHPVAARRAAVHPGSPGRGIFCVKVPDTGGVYLVPAFTGLGAPHWDMYARGTMVGLTRGTKPEHIIRAAQESIAYQSYDLVDAMERDAGVTPRS